MFATLQIGLIITSGNNMNNDPLHGVKLEEILIALEKKVGWKVMGETLNINCFTNNPRLKSSLKFLRKTPWARKKVEILYLKTFCKDHPATGDLIRNFIEQKNNSGSPSIKKENGFTWPTIKSK